MAKAIRFKTLSNEPLYTCPYFPIGYVYISVDSTNPGTIFGGTWEQIKDKFLLSSGDTYNAGETGGEATHKLTTSEIPAHTHGSKSLKGYWQNGNARFPGTNTFSGIVTEREKSIAGYWSETGGTATNTIGFNIDATHEHSSVGGSEAHNNMPPYLVVFVWKRVS